MKKFLTVTAVFLLVFPLYSCAPTVPKADYDTAVSDLAAAKAQVESLEKELAAQKNQTQSVQAELGAAQTQIKSLQVNVDSANEKIKQGKLRMEILNLLLVPVLKGAPMTSTEQLDLFFEFREKIKATGDAQLNAKFQELMDISIEIAKNPETYSREKIIRVSMNFYVYLLESMPKSLEDPKSY